MYGVEAKFANAGATVSVMLSVLNVIKLGNVDVHTILYLVVLESLLTVFGETRNAKVLTCFGATEIEAGGAELKLG